MSRKRKAPPVTTGYDPRAVERAPEFTDGHLPEGQTPHAAGDGVLNVPQDAPRSSPPTAPDGISGDWQ